MSAGSCALTARGNLLLHLTLSFKRSFLGSLGSAMIMSLL
jgi:hypothetical protein